MPDPEEVRFACIGCGAMNPAGAEVCEGCGHRFAGPAGGPVVRPEPLPIGDIPPMHFRDDDLYRPPRPNPDESILGCFAKVVGVIVSIIATFLAFVVTFFVTCTSIDSPQGELTLIVSLGAGLLAAGLVVAFTVWVASRTRGR